MEVSDTEVSVPPYLKDFIEYSESGTAIRVFKCPVEGCDFRTQLGVGALRAHIMINLEPKQKSYDSDKHRDWYSAGPQKDFVDKLEIMRDLSRYSER